MEKICIFAGTTEGKTLIRLLAPYARVTACVATEYGGELIEGFGADILPGRLDREQMEALFEKERFFLVIDATHPYAREVTENVKGACRTQNVPYLRVLRERADTKGAIFFERLEDAARYADQGEGNILLTTGSKELPLFASLIGDKERLYPRVLPLKASLDACEESGIPSSHLIAMQGPFSEEMNLALLKNYRIRYLVTKESGGRGGFPEKLSAAEKLGIPCLVIGRPPQEEGMSLGEAEEHLSSLLGFSVKRTVHLIGCGTGSEESMTIGAAKAIEEADMVIGSRRLCERFSHPFQQTAEAYLPEDVKNVLDSHKECRNFALLMSGDIGFYSGASRLYDVLKDYEITAHCGISTPVYLASRLKMKWEDMTLISLHGREANLCAAVRSSFRTFALAGGKNGVRELASRLCENGLDYVKLYVGENLSYPEEKITEGTALELSGRDFSSLSAVVIENCRYGTLLPVGLPDESFCRADKVPMTKSEVRAVSLSKLRLREDSVLWDIGAGSGSVSVEAAMYCRKGRVYAVEKNENAFQLMIKNQRKFGLENLYPIKGNAPEAQADLEAPTHVFIGGSSGNLKEILAAALEKNREARFVLNAVTLETLSETISLLDEMGFEDRETVELFVSRARKLKNYHLMTGMNPVFVISFQKGSEKEDGNEFE